MFNGKVCCQMLYIAIFNGYVKLPEGIYHSLGLDMSGQGPDNVLPSHPLCPEPGLSEWTPVAARASVFEFDLHISGGCFVVSTHHPQKHCIQTGNPQS